MGDWGTDAYVRAFRADEDAEDNPLPPEHIEHQAIQGRNACTPDVAASLADMWYETDVRGVLGACRPRHWCWSMRTGRQPLEEAATSPRRCQPQRSAGCRPRGWTVEDTPTWAGQIRDFIGIERPHPTLETVLSTVLFTDIVGSTEHQADVGDRAWRDVVQRHHAIVREALRRWHGKENDTAGDGFMRRSTDQPEQSAAPSILLSAYAT